jgi:hypothetical protein
MKIDKRTTTLRSCLLWVGILSLLGITLAVRLLTDQPLEPVVQLGEILQVAPKPPDPGPYLDPVSVSPVVPSLKPEPAGTSLVPSGIAKKEDLWRGKVSAWGNLSTNYGDVVANETIRLISTSISHTYSVVSDENGYFNFENIVPAPDYRISVSPIGMYKRVSMDSLAILTNQAALSIVLEPLELGTLKGKVVNTEGIVVPGYEMRIQSPLKARWVRKILSNIIGEFEIKNVPIGPIKITKTYGQILVISGHEFSGEPQTLIELVVDVGNNELKGVVYDEFNNTVPGATVVLDWKHHYQGTTSIVTRRSMTYPTGEFRFQGLGKGEHRLLVTTFDGLVGRQTIDVGNDNPERVVEMRKKRLSQE